MIWFLYALLHWALLSAFPDRSETLGSVIIWKLTPRSPDCLAQLWTFSNNSPVCREEVPLWDVCLCTSPSSLPPASHVEQDQVWDLSSPPWLQHGRIQEKLKSKINTALSHKDTTEQSQPEPSVLILDTVTASIAITLTRMPTKGERQGCCLFSLKKEELGKPQRVPLNSLKIAFPKQMLWAKDRCKVRDKTDFWC